MRLFHSKKLFMLAWVLVIVLGFILRVVKLDSIPAGLHQDEAWFGYNAFLLKETGASISGERLPLSVDMWGEQVPALHSYALIPWITIFGVNTFAFRFGIVVFSVVSIPLLGWIVWKLSRSGGAALLAGLLYAVSNWSLVMSRASSTVIIDGFVVLVLIAACVYGLEKLANLAQAGKNISGWLLIRWGFALYTIGLLAYLTYFTSRMMVPAVLIIFCVYALITVPHAVRRPALLGLLIPLFIYLIFPFALLMQTPFALGRFHETRIVGSDEIKVTSFLNITRSGMAGVPVLVTRTFFNKVVLNAQAFANQYIAFFSPDVLLTQTAPPKRYHVPNVGVLAWYEYLGFMLGVGAVAFGLFLPGRNPTDRQVSPFWTALFVLGGCLVVSLIPTALTKDDFPNLQRGVMSTPYWQMFAAVAYVWWGRLLLIKVRLKRAKTAFLFLGGAVAAIAILFQVGHFAVSYGAIARFSDPFYRSRPGEELGKWILEHAPNARLVMDTHEANFLYPYLYSRTNVRDLPIQSNNKHLLLATEFSIGQRRFYKNFCERKDVLQLVENAEVVIVRRYPTEYAQCNLGVLFEKVHSIAYDEGTPAYDIFRSVPKKPQPR